MATTDLTAGTVMNASAAALNDAARSTYNYTIQIPYLNMAMRELQEFYQLNEIPTVLEVTSAVINIPAGEVKMMHNATAPVPELPDDLVEPKNVWVSDEGLASYSIISAVAHLSPLQEGASLSSINEYVWQGQEILFHAAAGDLDVKIEYLKNLFVDITADTDVIGIINSQTFLQYRTAALMAQFVEENGTRAAELNGYASLGLDRIIGIGVKGGQARMTRRRPFRSGYHR